MATTYTLISSNVLTGSAASVTFSSIPSTYTDLVLRTSSRTDLAGGTDVNSYITFNGSSATNYSAVRLTGTGSAADSGLLSNQTRIPFSAMSEGTGYTTNTFSNTETYIPNYLVASNKPIGDFSVTENNATAARMYASASLWRDTTAISSITLTPVSGNYVSGSSFYLYGIKNS